MRIRSDTGHRAKKEPPQRGSSSGSVFFVIRHNLGRHLLYRGKLSAVGALEVSVVVSGEKLDAPALGAAKNNFHSVSRLKSRNFQAAVCQAAHLLAPVNRQIMPAV